ncbi:MAG: glycosyltransferase [Streptosporangiaceae bacterium]|nr:glycosyltransferase [Streptosporangiaceae bacterium]
MLAVASAAGLMTLRSSLFPYLLYVAISLLMGAVATSTLVWMLHAWRTPASLAASGLEADGRGTAHSFSLIVPARHEEAVLETTLSRLIRSDYPDFEVLVVVGADDPGTREAAERVAYRHPERVRVVIDHSWPKSKPKALNAALPHCSATITGVFDAEDDVHPALLRRVDQCFQRTDADIVQAGVQLMNFRSRWFAVHNVLEYYFWFRSRLHVHARQGFIPLGGNTVFIRTPILRAVAGWADCLAEDCEIGVRLSALGARTAVFYEPELATREECPPTVGAFVRQRTRWNQGYLQTLARGYWQRLPPRQRMLGAYILASPYVMALAWVMIPAAIATAVAVKAPIEITLLSFLPLMPMLSMLVAEGIGLGEFCRAYGERPSARDYGRLVFGLVPYQSLLAYAAARAVLRQARGAQGWEKTTHLGLHLGRPSSVAARSELAAPVPRVLEPCSESHALAENLAGSHQMTETQADALVPGLISLPREIQRTYGYVAAGPAADTDPPGNGHRELPIRSLDHAFTDHLFGDTGGAPLWARLDGATEGGAVPAPSGPHPRSRLLSPHSRLAAVRALLARLLRSRADIAVQVPLLVTVGLVQATNVFHWPAVLFDEGTYVGNAWAVAARGELGFYTYTYGHPPLAWLLFDVWTSVGALFGQAAYSLGSARELMSAVAIVSCSLLYTLARRLGMSRPFAVLAVLLFALSPLSLYFHRAMLLDNPATAWAIAAFVFALSPRKRLWSFVGGGACFAASVLSKETTLVMLPALVIAAFQGADPRTRRYCVTLLVSSFILVAAAFPLYATLKGELLPGPGHVSLIGSDVNMVATRRGTGSVLSSSSVGRGIVMFWLGLDPWLVGVALLLSPIALVRRNTRAVTLAYLIQAAIIMRPGYLPSMYVIALLPFAALIVAGTIHTLWRFATDDHPRRRLRGRHSRSYSARLRAAAAVTKAGAAASTIALAAVVAVAAIYTAPRWARSDHTATTVRMDGPELAAENWLTQHIGHEKRIIVRDDFWIYLIEHGFDSHPVKGGLNSRKVETYWPLDYDPAVQRAFPHGWQDFDYIVVTQDMINTLNQTPTAAAAISHSRLLVTFGQGTNRIEIRAIIGAHPETSRP